MDISNVAEDIKTIEQGRTDGAPADAFVEQERTAEEEAANRAAAELQQRKKRRKQRHRILMVLAVILLAVGVIGYRKYQEYQAAQAEAAADVLALEDGEELLYGEITQVIGNDITVAVVVEDASASSEDVNAKASDEGSSASGDSDANISGENGASDAPSGNMPAGDEMPAEDAADAAGDTAGGMPAGGSGDGPSMPSGDGDAAGGMPSGVAGGSGDMPSMPGGGSGSAGGPTGAPSGMGGMSRTTYTETGETREYQIPVGTDVTTMLGATTTFAKLKTGNVIGIVTEAGTDNILRIKIVQ